MKLAPLISLGLSAVLGIAAVFLGRYYMSSNSNDAAAQMSAPVVQMSSVVVAAAAIEPGEEVSASNVKTLNWPTESIPEGVVTDAADLSEILACGPFPSRYGAIRVWPGSSCRVTGLM